MGLKFLLYSFTTIFFIIESAMRIDIFNDIKKNKNYKSIFFRIIPYFCLTLLPAITFYLPYLSLTFFYLSWLAICLVQELLSPVSYKRITDYGKIRFLIFSSMHLCVIGAISVISTYTLIEILQTTSVMLNCTSITMILFILLKTIILTIDENFHFIIIHEQKKDFRYFYHFLNLSVANIILQSILCSFKFSLESAIGYLMCSNLISLVLMSNYIFNLSMIFQVEHAENSFNFLSSSLNQTNNRINQLKSSTHFDELTGAYSRIYLVQEVSRLLDSQTLFSIIYIDLNKLKNINDKYGHKAGDEYLFEFVSAIKLFIRSEDVLSRFGGDEFILLMPNCSKENATQRINDIKQKIKASYNKFSFSAGISDSNEAIKLEEMLSIADKRMYKEKLESRRNEL